jgi:hypothetical protein
VSRNILIVEPGYKTKFPPLGLMKISAYHKKLGDNVKFVKGIDQQIPYEKYWHRIYVSTVFTYNWKITIDTIKYYKAIVRDDISRIIVGGIMATLMPEDLWKETGIVPIRGVLCEPGVLDDDNKHVVEEMTPDYELFNDSHQKYSLVDDSYFGYSTRGCVRKCKFCGVHTLEPRFIDYEGIKPYIDNIKSLYGEKCHLVLFDNNILASKHFKKIIHDLIDLGFGKDAKISYKNKAGQTTYKSRHVDFNQGTDARLMTKSKIKLLSKIALNPLRIAFDHIKDKELYSEKIRLASNDKNGIRYLSNYILYNFKDTPEDLWKRLKINIDLNKELDLKIYSFPMKYIPLNAKDRSYIDEPRWNWQYIRGVQRILNVLKGSVMTTEDFFYRAFGKNEKEFLEILHMPESIIMHRTDKPKTREKEWRKKFRNLTKNEKLELLAILCNNRKKQRLIKAYVKTKNRKLKNILSYYVPPDTDKNINLPLFEDL